MSEERKSVKHDKENNVIEFQGTPTKERKVGAKKVDLKSFANLFETDFYLYYPDGSVDLKDHRKKDGSIDISSIPEENLFEIQCRYIDPGTYQQIYNTAYVIDIPGADDLSPDELHKIYQKSVRDQITDKETDLNLRYQVVLQCLIDPEVKTLEDVKRLPINWVNDIFNSVTESVYGGNLMSRF